MSPARRSLDGCYVTWTSLRLNADLRQPCTPETRHMTPCPPTFESDFAPPSRPCLKQPPQRVRCAPASTHMTCCVPSRASLRRLMTAIPRMHGAWLLCWWTVYATAPGCWAEGRRNASTHGYTIPDSTRAARRRVPGKIGRLETRNLSEYSCERYRSTGRAFSVRHLSPPNYSNRSLTGFSPFLAGFA